MMPSYIAVKLIKLARPNYGSVSLPLPYGSLPLHDRNLILYGCILPLHGRNIPLHDRNLPLHDRNHPLQYAHLPLPYAHFPLHDRNLTLQACAPSLRSSRTIPHCHQTSQHPNRRILHGPRNVLWTVHPKPSPVWHPQQHLPSPYPPPPFSATPEP